MDDSARVAALVSGDPRGLEDAYRAYADRIYTYCRGMLRDPDAAADALHDTFILASQRAHQLRDPARLRSWLYAIARNECLRLLRGRARAVPLEAAGQMSVPETDPVAEMRAAEIQELVWAAAASLNPGDREVFELTVRHELPAHEIGEALGISSAHAHARLSRARAQLERALGALLVARTGASDCPQLAESLRSWDGTLTALIRKRISRHIDSCEVCGERQRRQLQPAALFAAYASAPFLLAPAELLPRLRLTNSDPGHAPVRAAVTDRAGRFRSDTGFPRPLDVRRRRLRVAGVSAVAVAALLAAGAGAMIAPDTPLAGAPEPLPTAAALAPVTTPPATAALASSAPSATGAPTPTPRPAGPAPPPVPPPPPTRSPSPPAPLDVTVDVQSACQINGDFTVTVTVAADQAPESGEFTVRTRSAAPPPEPLVIDGREATATVRGLEQSPVGWSVEVTFPGQQFEESGRLDVSCDGPVIRG